jgi:predicted PurR-regulated permease PerM
MLGKRLIQIWVNYLKSQLVLMVFIGVLTYLFARVVGLPYALLMATLATIGEGILATITAVIVALLKGSTVLNVENWIFALIILAGYILIQLLENWIIKPKVVGSMLNLNPWLALIGLIIAGAIFGIPGVLLVTPVMVSIREIVHYFFYENRNPPQPSSTP